MNVRNETLPNPCSYQIAKARWVEDADRSDDCNYRVHCLAKRRLWRNVSRRGIIVTDAF